MEPSQAVFWFLFVIFALFVLGTILSGFFQVRTAEACVVQRVGKFLRVATAGINFKFPWLDHVAGRTDLRVQQLALDVETKTQDNVFVRIPVSVQHHVIPTKVYEAFYKLANPAQQVSSYVFNIILGHVPKMNLDDAFLHQADIAVAIKEGLDEVMNTTDFRDRIVRLCLTADSSGWSGQIVGMTNPWNDKSLRRLFAADVIGGSSAPLRRSCYAS